jgi:hypothetical protein
VGIFSRRIATAYQGKPSVPVAVSSPWQPNDVLTQWTVDQMFAEEMASATGLVTRDMALRVPAVKRAHGIHCTLFAQTPFRQITTQTGAVTPDQPDWMENSRSGMSPYHRKFGMASDWFFNGWTCLGFTADPLTNPDADALHIPYGLWTVKPDGTIDVSDLGHLNDYRTFPVAIPLGYGENGLLVDGIDTIREARLIETAYMDRLENPIPLTILGVPREVWDTWSPDEKKFYRDQYVAGRKATNGSVALKVAEFPIEFPGETPVDLYESGRNAARLDIANHTATPAGLIEGVRQGGSGGGTEIRYSGVANGAARSELWDFGLAKRFVLAFEGRMSLDDISPNGTGIRGDLGPTLDIPAANTNPAIEA